IILTTHYIDEAESLSEEVIILHKGRLVEKGNVKDLLKKFDGKVRIEGFGNIRIGNTRISYVNKEEAKKYIELGATIKPITLEDILIMHGVTDDENRYSSEEY
ncbi:MAG: ABC transporter ATP-binding protein, partial [Sulfolobaceae archaeon]